MSFDILRDGDGEGREQFPLSMLLCAGTQADTALSNRYKQTNTVFKAAVDQSMWRMLGALLLHQDGVNDSIQGTGVEEVLFIVVRSIGVLSYTTFQRQI